MERAICYLSSFTCTMMSVVWCRKVVPIDLCNKVIPASDAALEMKVANIESLLAQLMARRDSWKTTWHEAKLVACCLQIEVKLLRHRSTTDRKRTIFHDEDELDENVSEMNEVDLSSDEANFR